MKRIVFAVSNDLNYDQRMQKICSSLQAAGYRVTLVGRQKKDSLPLEKQPFHQRRIPLIFERGKLFYFELNIRLFFYLLFTPFDIVGAIDLDTILPCLAAGKLKSKKRIYDAHEYFTEVPEVVNRPRIQRLWQKVEQFSVPKMHLCYTVSDSLAGLFSEKLEKKFYVIRNLPSYLPLTEVRSHNPTHQDIDSKAGYILYQGALNEGRGLEDLIKAMKRLPLKLVLAGEGDLSRELRKLTMGLGLEQRVEFKGWVRPAKLKELTAKAFVGYNLLENRGKSYYYSLSNKFFDYVMAGVPSLSPPFPEYEKINTRFNIALLTNLSEENIVKSIERLLKDKFLYAELQSNCLSAAKELNWPKEEKKLISLYAGL